MEAATGIPPGGGRGEGAPDFRTTRERKGEHTFIYPCSPTGILSTISLNHISEKVLFRFGQIATYIIVRVFLSLFLSLSQLAPKFSQGCCADWGNKFLLPLLLSPPKPEKKLASKGGGGVREGERRDEYL